VVTHPCLLDLDAARARLRLSETEAREIVEHEALLLADRRERRRVKGIGNRRPRCGNCMSFLKSDLATCKVCGFMPGQGIAA
jgi:hypothetical protein